MGWGSCKHGSKACWICHSFGQKLGKDFRGRPEFEPKDRKALLHAFGQCHTRNRGFDFFKKFAYHKDFKQYECRGTKNKKSKKKRKAEFQRKFYKRFGIT